MLGLPLSFLDLYLGSDGEQALTLELDGRHLDTIRKALDVGISGECGTRLYSVQSQTVYYKDSANNNIRKLLRQSFTMKEVNYC